MSAYKQFTDQQVKNGAGFAKLLKWFAWAFIGLGLMLTITVFAAPIGIPTTVIGAAMLWASKYLAKSSALLSTTNDTPQAAVFDQQVNQAQEQAAKKD